jgi:hypothetical protein
LLDILAKKADVDPFIIKELHCVVGDVGRIKNLVYLTL